jgi:hypothetical protein
MAASRKVREQGEDRKMKLDKRGQGLIWGGLLVILGAMMLLETSTGLSAWTWVVVLALAGLGMFALWFVANREDLSKASWAGLIPAYVMLAVAALVGLLEFDILRDPFVAPFVLALIALPFLVTFLRDRSRWWALIPSYILLAVGLMLLLTESGLMDDELVPPYVLFAIAIPFFVVYARKPRQWWPLIPGGILAIIGISFLIAEAAVEYVGAVVLVVVGLWIVARQFLRQASDAEGLGAEGLGAEESGDASSGDEPSTALEAKAEGPAEEAADE